MTLHEAIKYGEEQLRSAGIQDPAWNSEQLLLLALNMSRALLYSGLQSELSEEQRIAFDTLLQRRSLHEPLAYIEGTQEFFGREFHVGPGVLIPRPETQEIVKAALNLELPRYPIILDIGAGSGCIAATLAVELPHATVNALESSTAALPFLRQNAGALVHAIRGDLFQPPFVPGCFDLIVSNPPYVEEQEYQTLPPETLWEPREALLATSLESVYEALLHSADLLLKPGGFLIFEFGYGQEKRLEALCGLHPTLNLSSIIKDFRNIFRTAVLRKT